MTRKPPITAGDCENSGESLQGLARSRAMTSRLSAAYAEMTADNDREAEAEQWLAAVSAAAPRNKA
jgi:hypothetical protein